MGGYVCFIRVGSMARVYCVKLTGEELGEKCNLEGEGDWREGKGGVGGVGEEEGRRRKRSKRINGRIQDEGKGSLEKKRIKG